MTDRLRVSDADRTAVVDVLHTAYADGRISPEEHSERVDAALAARTVGDLTTLTVDLQPGQIGPVPGPQPAVVVPDPTAPPSETVTALLSTTRRDGEWPVRRRTSVSVALGSVQLDMTRARFDAATVEVNLTSLMAEVTIRVPAGTTVRTELSDVLAETSVKGVGPPDPAMPVLVLRGTSVLSDVKVRGPRRPLPWRRALR